MKFDKWVNNIQSPVRLLVVVMAGSIFLVETVVMLILLVLPPLSGSGRLPRAEHGADGVARLRAADLAHYRAKDEGRDQVMVGEI